MLDWLSRRPDAQPTCEVLGRELPVVIRRLGHARRMTLRLAPDGSEIRLTMPRWGRTAEAMQFVRSRADWLASQAASLPRPEPIADGSLVPYRGQLLRLVHKPAGHRRVLREEDVILVGGPADMIARRLRRWLEDEARTIIAQDLSHFCDRQGLPTPRLALSNAQRRWGSCARNGAIRINWRLVMAPDHVRRSVVAHEVAHLVHFDHSPRFHAVLAELFDGDIEIANGWLRKSGRSLYAPFG